MIVLTYNQKLKPRAREFRKNQTQAEKLLWKQIRRKQIKGYQFLRQRPIGNFIVDFVCLRSKLIIEINGPIHIQRKNTDQFRQEQLEILGFKVLRFSNTEIKDEMSLVLQKVAVSMMANK